MKTEAKSKIIVKLIQMLNLSAEELAELIKELQTLSPSLLPDSAEKVVKRRGRPPKVKAKAEVVPEVETREAVKLQEQVPKQIIPSIRSDFQIEDDEAYAAQRMGKELPLAALYQHGDKLIKSFYVLTDSAFLGVFVPYLKSFKDGGEFVVYYKDEVAYLPKVMAQKYARSRLPQINGQKWDIFTGQQLKSIKAKISELNQVLKKNGGEVLTGTYLEKNDERIKMEKIRYAVDIDP